MEKKISIFEAVAILVGTTIGAGVLALPYAISQAGYWPGVALLTVVYLAILVVNLYLGEVSLSTKDDHQLAGYAHKYLGLKGWYLMIFFTVVGFFGNLLAYIIGEGEVLGALTGGNPFVYSIIFFIFGAAMIYIGLSVIKNLEFLLTMIVLTFIVAISLITSNHWSLNNLLIVNWHNWFLPYGVVLFAMGGASAIPSMRRILKGNEQKLKKAIIIGTTIPYVVYLIFITMVIGVAGSQVTEIATIGLGSILGKNILVLGNLFAFFTMATSFLTIGLALKDTFIFDLKISRNLAWLITVSVPLLLFIFGLNDFTKVIGLVGAIGAGVQGILFGLIYFSHKNKKERSSEYQMSKSLTMVILLSLIFIGGLIFTLSNL